MNDGAASATTLVCVEVTVTVVAVTVAGGETVKSTSPVTATVVVAPAPTVVVDVTTATVERPEARGTAAMQEHAVERADAAREESADIADEESQVSTRFFLAADAAALVYVVKVVEEVSLTVEVLQEVETAPEVMYTDVTIVEVTVAVWEESSVTVTMTVLVLARTAA